MGRAITPRELFSAIEAGTAPAIVDVRYRSEFAEGRVPGAVNIPYWRALAGVPRIPAAVDDPIVLYCGHGPRARIFQTALRLRGYHRTVLMTGHWAAWQEPGLPEER